MADMTRYHDMKVISLGMVSAGSWYIEKRYYKNIE